MTIGLSARTFRPGLDRPQDEFRLLRVLARKHDHVAGFLGQHSFHEVRAGVDFFLPMRRLVGPRVEPLDPFQMFGEVVGAGA
jgi:hypothetical protein